MQVVEIKYRRVKNLGNYESEEVVLSGVPSEGEDYESCLYEIKAKVLDSLGLDPKRFLKTSTVPTTATPPVEDKKEAAVNKFEEEKKAKEAAEKEERKAVRAAKKAKREKEEKPILYTRKEKAHRDLLGSVLNEHFTGWSSDPEMVALAKKTSVSVEGQPFTDHNGAVLPDFVRMVVDKMSVDGGNAL